MFHAKRALKCFMFLLLMTTLILSNSLVAQEESEQASGEKSEKQNKIDRLFQMSLEELMDVRITTAGKTSQRIGDIPASVVLITREDIETYGYQTLAEILQNVPGLFGIDDLEYEGINFGVRGFWSSVPNRNMIILVDGVSQMNDMSFNFPLRTMAIPVEAIDRIEVIRGPMSVIYGNGAFYGVINIFTRDISVNNKPVSQVSLSMGTNNTRKIALRLADKLDNLNYAFSASYYDSNGPDFILADMTKDLSVLSSPDASTHNTLENTEKYVNFSAEFKHFYVNLSYNDTKKEFLSFLPTYGDGTYVKNNRAQASIGYKRNISNKVSMDATLTYTFNRDYFNYDHLFEDFYGIQEMETNSWEFDLDTFITPSDTLEMSAGIVYRSIFNATNMYDLPSFGVPSLENNYIFLLDDDEIVTQAVYAHFAYKPFSKLSLIGGIRLEQSPNYGMGRIRTNGNQKTLDEEGGTESDKIEFIPRVAAIFYMNEKNIFKFLYGEAILRPSFDQNRQNAFDDTLLALEPENIQTLELNYIASFSQRFNLNLSLFRNSLENLITRIVEHETPEEYRTYSGNAGKMITNGIELTLNAEPIEYLRMELSGTYQHTEDNTINHENISQPYSPKFLGYLKASYLGVGFSASITGNYVGAMKTYWEIPENGQGYRIGDEVSGYFLLGANLRIDELFIEGLYLNVKCSNILDEKFRYPTTTLSSWLNKGTLGMGRAFLVSLGYKF